MGSFLVKSFLPWISFDMLGKSLKSMLRVKIKNKISLFLSSLCWANDGNIGKLLFPKEKPAFPPVVLTPNLAGVLNKGNMASPKCYHSDSD